MIMDDVSMDDDSSKWMRCLIMDSGHSIQHINPQYHIQYQLQKKDTKYKGSYCVTTCACMYSTTCTISTSMGYLYVRDGNCLIYRLNRILVAL